jgi:hypothetical protein
MANELRVAMNKWFEVLSKNEDPRIVRNVTHHAEALARSQDNPAMPIAMNVPTMLSFTTSSPWTPPSVWSIISPLIFCAPTPYNFA